MPGAQAGDEFSHAEIRQYSQGYYAQGRAALPLLNRYLPAQTRAWQHKTIDTGAAARLTDAPRLADLNLRAPAQVCLGRFFPRALFFFRIFADAQARARVFERDALHKFGLPFSVSICRRRFLPAISRRNSGEKPLKRAARPPEGLALALSAHQRLPCALGNQLPLYFRGEPECEREHF